MPKPRFWIEALGNALCRIRQHIAQRRIFLLLLVANNIALAQIFNANYSVRHSNFRLRLVSYVVVEMMRQIASLAVSYGKLR